MSVKKQFSKAFQINHAIVVVLPKEFCEKHGIVKGDYLQRLVDVEGIKFIPQEVRND